VEVMFAWKRLDDSRMIGRGYCHASVMAAAYSTLSQNGYGVEPPKWRFKHCSWRFKQCSGRFKHCPWRFDRSAASFRLRRSAAGARRASLRGSFPASSSVAGDSRRSFLLALLPPPSVRRVRRRLFSR